jgi:hypothetical protein
MREERQEQVGSHEPLDWPWSRPPPTSACQKNSRSIVLYPDRDMYLRSGTDAHE